MLAINNLICEQFSVPNGIEAIEVTINCIHSSVIDFILTPHQ